MQIKQQSVIILQKTRAGNSDNIKGSGFSKGWNGSKHFLKIIASLQYVTALGKPMTSYLFMEDEKEQEQSNITSPQKIDVKAWAILRAWSHTELKQAGRKASHAEDSSSIIQSSSWNTVWSWYRHTAQILGSTTAPTVHLAGDRSWPSSWRDPASVAGGLCPTCSCWAPSCSNLVSPCNKPAT